MGIQHGLFPPRIEQIEQLNISPVLSTFLNITPKRLNILNISPVLSTFFEHRQKILNISPVLSTF